ncbi:MAG: redoxin family protein [Patescibacteria group bacterium]|jgi:thiol-disulfide isomerase/thioredoxin
MLLHRIGKVRAAEFPPNIEWLNSKPLKMKELLGKVVLLDFWTFSCANCLRVVHFLLDWQKKYESQGLVVIGVHSPEFAFEKEKENVECAIDRLGITYPVALDPDYKIWNLYANRWWPRSFVVDHRGYIEYDHIGERGYAETESAIQAALAAIGAKDLPAITPDPLIGGGICYRVTPETYLGFLRGRYGNGMDLVPNVEHSFTDQGNHEEDLVYLHGHWLVGGEFIAHARDLSAPTEYILVKYGAFAVNAVLKPYQGGKAEVEVTFDGMPLPKEIAGIDIVYRGDQSIVKVTESRLYQLVNSERYHRGTLKISTKSSNIAMYALTFGGCKDI